MSKHPFRVAIESGASQAQLEKLFTPDVALKAPMLTQPVSGIAQVIPVISAAAKVAGPIRYTLEVRDSTQTILFWNGKVGGHTLEAVTILVEGDDGLVHEIRVLMRSWPVATLFRNAMYDALSDTIPPTYWELGPKPVSSSTPRSFTPIALQPFELAPDIVLHSPILARSVSGATQVEASVKLAHSVQSRSSYTSIVANPDTVIELFDCDADGYPMEGLWMQKLNDRGQVYDLTVMLRPYPAVTVLRNRAKALAEQNGLLSIDYWELPGATPPQAEQG